MPKRRSPLLRLQILPFLIFVATSKPLRSNRMSLGLSSHLQNSSLSSIYATDIEFPSINVHFDVQNLILERLLRPVKAGPGASTMEEACHAYFIVFNPALRAVVIICKDGTGIFLCKSLQDG